MGEGRAVVGVAAAAVVVVVVAAPVLLLLLLLLLLGRQQAQRRQWRWSASFVLGCVGMSTWQMQSARSSWRLR